MTIKKKKKFKVKNFIILLAIVGIAIGLINSLNKSKEAALAEITPAPTEDVIEDEEITKEDNKVSFFFTGDAILHESVYVDAQNGDGSYNFDKQLHHIKDIAKEYDLAYYNQETILGGSGLGLSGYPVFNSPYEFGDYMVDAGFNMVSTANNHCLDKGTVGIENSHKYWKSKSGILMQGTNTSEEEYDEIKSVEVKGIKFAFLSYTYGTNGINPEYPYQVNYYPNNDEEIIEKIKKAKLNNDVVIMAMHWGTEYSMEVNIEQQSLAEKYIEAGADVIVGNHPHVIQPFQEINGKPVFYAMGNLLSSQLDEENLVGMIGAMDFIKKDDGSVKIENVRCDLIWTAMEGEYPGLRYNIEVIPFVKLNDSKLPNHESIYEKYKAIITSLGFDIQFGGI